MSTLTSPLASIGNTLTTDGSRQPFRTWVSALLTPALLEVGWSPLPNEPDERRALRGTLIEALGRTARDPEVLSKAREVVLQELATPGSVESTLLNAAVDVAAIKGDAALYEKYLARSKAATDTEERYRYLDALTSFTGPALVRRTMDYVLGPEVRNQDAKSLIASLLGSREAQALVWRMLQARWDEIQKKTGEFVGNTVIIGGLSAFCDARTVGEIRKFFAAHKVPDAERTLQQTIERIGDCAALASAQNNKLAEWLRAGSG